MSAHTLYMYASRGFATFAVLAAAAATSAFGQADPAAGPADPAASPADPLARLADAPIVPVHDEPHHRQLFQYGPTRVLELQIPPGDISWYHTHEWPVLYLTLGQSQTRTQELGADPAAGRGGPGGAARGAPGGAAPRAGGPGGARAGGPGAGARGAPGGGGGQTTGPRAFSTTGYIERPVTHFVQNLGTGLFRAMVVVNETAGDPEDSIPSTGFAGEPELTNPWFRSYRVTLAPGESMAAHRHQTPIVILQATPGTGRSEGPMPWEYNEPGQWGFYDAGVEHSIRNLGDEPIELLEVEVRIVP